jgi:tocopherol cyclase
VQSIRSIIHPEQFHGFTKKKNFFEGWYFKIVSKNEDRSLAFIPGIAINGDGKKNAFIQIVDGNRNEAQFIEYQASDFTAHKKRFQLEIAGNHFNNNGIDLNLPNLEGRVIFDNHVKWPGNILSPNVMGPLNYFPFLECYHGILSMNHGLSGTLMLNGEEIDFEGGKGYTEKDWGHSFPLAHVWMQSNHFSTDNISFQASIAKVNVWKRTYTGFVAGLWLDGSLIQFTSYHLSKLKNCQLNQNKAQFTLENRRYCLEITAKQSKTASLIAPHKGKMNCSVNESLTSEIDVQLTEKKSGQVVFEDTGRAAGLEIAGQIKGLTK